MDSLELIKTEQGLHIEGFPDAVHVFRLDGHKAQRLADLALHKGDLIFGLQCLEAINASDSFLVREALWVSAIVHFFKCFGRNGARFSLSSNQVFRSDLEGLEVFRYMKALRDKHLVHDENTFALCEPAAILNPLGIDSKIAKVICLGSRAVTLDQANFSNLHLLLSKA